MAKGDGMLDDSGYDDRSFDEQMNDLGVEVIRQKADGLKNLVWLTTWGNVKSLADKIRLNKSTISFGKEALQMLFEESEHKKIRIGVAEYRSRKVLVLRPSAVGYAVVQGKEGRPRAGSALVVKKLLDHGLSLGIYNAKKVKGGIVCIFEGGKHETQSQG